MEAGRELSSPWHSKRNHHFAKLPFPPGKSKAKQKRCGNSFPVTPEAGLGLEEEQGQPGAQLTQSRVGHLKEVRKLPVP